MRSTDVDRLERELVGLSSVLTSPRERECLVCYVYRMLEFHCRCDLRWTLYWRDLRAPRATALVRRLSAVGSVCDCKVFMNGWQPRSPLPTADLPRLDDPDGLDGDGFDGDGFDGDGFDDLDDLELGELAPRYPERMPPCPGVRPGSTQPCLLWVPKPRLA